MTIESNDNRIDFVLAADYDVAAAYVRLILQGGSVSPAVLLEGSGLSEETLGDTGFVSWRSLAAVFENLHVQAGSSVWLAELGERLNITSHGALGFAALTAPTLGDAMATMATYYRARITTVEMTLCEVEQDLQLTVCDVTGDPVFSERVALIILKVVESLLVAILGTIPDNAIKVSLARPKDADASLIRGMYRAKVRFGAEAYCIAIPASWKNMPSPLHERTVYRDNMLECQRLIERSNAFSGAAGMVSFMLRAYLDASLAGQDVPVRPPTLGVIAERMAVTPRTLIRRLKQEGESYQGTLDVLRKEYAERLLADVGFSVAEIATLLGYTEPPNFGRAFRRWYGVSPATWRRTKSWPKR